MTDLEISTDPGRLDVDQIHRWLSEDAYWALGRSREVVERSIAHSLNFGVYDDGQLVGYARVSLEPGASASVAFELHADRFSFTGLDRRRIVEAGVVTLTAGLSLTDATRPAAFTITGPVRVVADPVLLTGVRIEQGKDV